MSRQGTRMEELLREALADAPTPQPTLLDPQDELARLVRHARARRYAAFATAAVVVVLAAVLTPTLVLSNHAGKPGPITQLPTPEPTPATAEHAKAQTWQVKDMIVDSAAYAAGSVWLAGEVTTGSGGQWGLSQVDPRTGHQIRRVDVPGPVTWVSFGLGKLWLYGGGDGGYPDGRFDVVDPSTGHLVATTTTPGGAQKVAFGYGSAWFPLGNGQTLLRLTLSGNRLRASTLRISGTYRGITSTADGHVFLGAVHGRILDVVPNGTGIRIAHRYSWPGQVMSADPAGGSGSVWASEGSSQRSRLVELTPSMLAGCDSCAYGNYRLSPGITWFEAAPGRSGIFVEGMNVVTYYAFAALQRGAYTSTDRLQLPDPSDQIESMTPAGDSAVVVTTSGTILHWTPRG